MTPLCVCANEPRVPGDVKPENIMVTSWNWVFLTDFATFKPTFLPADNDVSLLFYYFEPVKNRSRCCIAPERFVSVPVTSSDKTGGASSRALNALSPTRNRLSTASVSESPDASPHGMSGDSDGGRRGLAFSYDTSGRAAALMQVRSVHVFVDTVVRSLRHPVALPTDWLSHRHAHTSTTSTS